MRRAFFQVLIAVLLAGPSAAIPCVYAGDWPMLGRTANRNAASPERGAPIDWDVGTGRNIKWSAPLGTTTYGDPVVSGGLVWIGTNNGLATADAAVLACFRESDGKPL